MHIQKKSGFSVNDIKIIHSWVMLQPTAPLCYATIVTQRNSTQSSKEFLRTVKEFLS